MTGDFSGSLSFGGLTRTYRGHLPVLIVGRASRQLAASAAIWDFFRQHSL